MEKTPAESFDPRKMTDAEAAWLGVREGDAPLADFKFTPKDVVVGAATAALDWASEHRGHIKGVVYTVGAGVILHELAHSGIAFGQDGTPPPIGTPEAPAAAASDGGIVNAIVTTVLERPLTAMGWVIGGSAAYGATYSSWKVFRQALDVRKYNNGPEGLAELEVLTEQYEDKRIELRKSLTEGGFTGEKLEAKYKAQCLEKGLATDPKLLGYDWGQGRTIILLTAFQEAVEGANVAVKLVLLPQLFTAEGRALLAQAITLTKDGLSETDAVAAIMKSPRIAELAVIGLLGAVATFNDVIKLFQQRIIASGGKQRQPQQAG